MQGETEARPIEQPVKNGYEYLMLSDYLEPLNHPVGERLGYDENHCSKVFLGEAGKKRGSLVPYFCKEKRKSGSNSCCFGIYRYRCMAKGNGKICNDD